MNVLVCRGQLVSRKHACRQDYAFWTLLVCILWFNKLGFRFSICSPAGSKADTVRCRDNTVNFLTNIHERHPIALPLGLFIVDPASAWVADPVSLIIYVISYNIGPRYNGTRLYDVIPRYVAWLWLVVCIPQFTGKQSLASGIRETFACRILICVVYTQQHRLQQGIASLSVFRNNGKIIYMSNTTLFESRANKYPGHWASCYCVA